MLSFIVSLLIIEYVLTGFVKYPKYQIGTRVYYLKEDDPVYSYLSWRPEHYKYWSVEGGNKLLHYNNHGLPGPDVSIQDTTKNIFLLGNSFIEAAQIEGELSSAGYLQNSLKNHRYNYQVINLGESAYDPYGLYLRALFFEKYYTPNVVILVYESFSRIDNYFQRLALPVDFDRSVGFGKQLTYSKTKGYYDRIKSLSIMATLCFDPMKEFIKKTFDLPPPPPQNLSHKKKKKTKKHK